MWLHVVNHHAGGAEAPAHLAVIAVAQQDPLPQLQPARRLLPGAPWGLLISAAVLRLLVSRGVADARERAPRPGRRLLSLPTVPVELGTQLRKRAGVERSATPVLTSLGVTAWPRRASRPAVGALLALSRRFGFSLNGAISFRLSAVNRLAAQLSDPAMRLQIRHQWTGSASVARAPLIGFWFSMHQRLHSLPRRGPSIAIGRPVTTSAPFMVMPGVTIRNPRGNNNDTGCRAWFSPARRSALPSR